MEKEKLKELIDDELKKYKDKVDSRYHSEINSKTPEFNCLESIMLDEDLNKERNVVMRRIKLE